MLSGEKRSLDPSYFSFILSKKASCVHHGESFSLAAVRPRETECSSIPVLRSPAQAVALRPDQCNALFFLLKVSVWVSYLPAKEDAVVCSFF